MGKRAREGRAVRDTKTKSPNEVYQHRKTIPCPVCGSMHSCQFNLDQHMRTHTGEKPFRCQFCSVGFTRAWPLTRHTKKLHPEMTGLPQGPSSTRSMKASIPASSFVVEHPKYDGQDVSSACGDMDGQEQPSKRRRQGEICVTNPNLDGQHLSSRTLFSGVEIDLAVDDTYPLLTSSSSEMNAGSMNTMPEGCLNPTWTLMVGRPPPPQPAVFMCNECGMVSPRWTTALHLQVHRHQSHPRDAPLSQNCMCELCRQAFPPIVELDPRFAADLACHIPIDPQLEQSTTIWE